MIQSAVSWVLRAGALLVIVSVFLPQVAINDRPHSPFVAARALSSMMAPLDFAVHAAWLTAPWVAGLAVLGGSVRTGRRGGVARGAAVGVCLAAAFALATQGSILMTRVQGGGGSALGLALFVTPLVAATVIVARVLGAAAPEPTAGVARLSLGVFLVLNGLFLADWWSLLAAWMGAPGTDRLLPGAWAAPAGGLLVAAAEAVRLFRPQSGQAISRVDLK